MNSLIKSGAAALRAGLKPSAAYGVARDTSTPVWKGLYATAAAAFAIRLAVALWSVRTGYPDELFQYLEQAHRLVYGYGFVPWEYRFGVRNWLLPGTLAALLEFIRLLHIDHPGAYVPVLKSIFAAVSVCLVFASYTIGRQLFSERTGRIAAVLAAVWYDLLSASSLATPEVFGAYAIFGGFAIATLGPGIGFRRALWIGLLIGAGVALRVQYMLPAAAVWSYVLLVWGRRYAPLISVASLAVPILAGVLDYVFWGAPFASYVNYFLFGSVYSIGDVFGDEPPLWYATALTTASLGLYPVAILYAVTKWKRCWMVLLLIGLVLVPHSLVAHKEYRFIFLAIPFTLLLVADLLVLPFARLQQVIIAWVCIVSIVGCWQNEVFARDDHLLSWADLSRRDDVKAVFDLTGPWWLSGGFYYLHHDVPVYFPLNLTEVQRGEFRFFASHILVRTNDTDIPGFRVSSSRHDIAILEQISPPSTYRHLPGDVREIQQPGIDERFTPQVRRRF